MTATAELSYTPDKANAALPLVRAIVGDIVQLEERLADAERAYAELRADPARPQAPLNDTRREIVSFTAQRDACIAELTELGLRIDDAALGFCDFPADVEGRAVYLCWELGEAAVLHVHGRDESWTERTPLPVVVTAG